MSFNGGKSQAQSEYLPGGDYPLVNMFKYAGIWGGANGAVVSPDDLDINGYLTVDNYSGGASTSLSLPPKYLDGATTWVMTWDGQGTVFIQGASSATSGSYSNLLTSSPGRVEFNIPASTAVGSYPDNDGGVLAGVSALKTAGTNYPHNIQLFLKSEESFLGQNWRPDFLNLITAANIGVLRSLNWGLANFSNATTWATRKQLGYYTYASDDLRGSAWGAGALFGGTASGTGDNFTLTLSGQSGVAPVDKQTVQFFVDHDSISGTTWTFNLNGTGSLPIIDVTSIDSNRIYGLNVGILMTAVFDADLQSWYKMGAPSQSHGLRNGMPPELFFDLCNRLRCHPWFVVPPLASDPATDWLVSLDNYIQANAPSWMITRYEMPNENWNTLFWVNSYSFAKGNAYWGQTYNTQHAWAGRAAAKLGKILDTNRSGDRSKYQWIAGVQTGVAFTANGGSNITSFSNLRLNCTRSKGFNTVTFTNGSANIGATGNTLSLSDPITFDTTTSVGSLPANFVANQVYYVKSTGATITVAAALPVASNPAVSAGSAGSGAGYSLYYNDPSPTTYPAYNWVTGICITNYINADATNTLAEMTAGYRLLMGDTSQIDTYAVANDINTAPHYVQQYAAAWYAWANGFGPALKLSYYEGGWSQDYIPLVDTNWGVISGASAAANCVLTVLTTNYNGGNPTGPNGHAFIAGMPLQIDQVTGTMGTALNQTSKNISFSTGTPGTVNWGSAHGFAVGQAVTFGAAKLYHDSTFNMPKIDSTHILTPGIVYYVKDNAPGADNTKFTISATNGGTAISLIQSATSTVTASACWVVQSVTSTTVTINANTTGLTPTTNTGRAFYGCCEGGNGGAGSANWIDAIRIASKTSATLNDMTLLGYQQMTDPAVVGVRAEFPSCFQIASATNAWSVWDPDIYASPTPPQWIGITRFNAVASTITAAFSVMQDNSRYRVRMIGY